MASIIADERQMQALEEVESGLQKISNVKGVLAGIDHGTAVTISLSGARRGRGANVVSVTVAPEDSAKLKKFLTDYCNGMIKTVRSLAAKYMIRLSEADEQVLRDLDHKKQPLSNSEWDDKDNKEEIEDASGKADLEQTP